MTDLTPITALGGRAPRSETFGALNITENSELALASLALKTGQAAPSPFGLTLPEPGKAATVDGAGAFWTGPGQWMIEGPGQAEGDFAATVLMQASEASVTEQTDGFTAFEILSSNGAAPIEALMAKLVNVDPAGFAPGSATRTGLEHMTVFLVRRADDRLAVIGMRTLAKALWHALAAAAGRLET